MSARVMKKAMLQIRRYELCLAVARAALLCHCCFGFPVEREEAMSADSRLVRSRMNLIQIQISRLTLNR
jgi:hypothetical protein